MNRHTDRQMDRETAYNIELRMNQDALYPIRIKKSKENLSFTI